MQRRACFLGLVTLIVLAVSHGCSPQRPFLLQPERGENVAVIRAIQEEVEGLGAEPGRQISNTRGFQITRIDGERQEDFCHEVVVPPGQHTLVLYYFYSTWATLPPREGTNHFHGPITIEIDAKAGHTYTIVGHENEHTFIEEAWKE